MIHSCHLLPDCRLAPTCSRHGRCSLRLAGLKGNSPLTPAAAQAFLPEALAGKISVVKVPFTQRFRRYLIFATFRVFDLQGMLSLWEGNFFLRFFTVVYFTFPLAYNFYQ